jgi:hypothetical protein
VRQCHQRGPSLSDECAPIPFRTEDPLLRYDGGLDRLSLTMAGEDNIEPLHYNTIIYYCNVIELVQYG